MRALHFCGRPGHCVTHGGRRRCLCEGCSTAGRELGLDVNAQYRSLPELGMGCGERRADA